MPWKLGSSEAWNVCRKYEQYKRWTHTFSNKISNQVLVYGPNKLSF